MNHSTTQSVIQTSLSAVRAPYTEHLYKDGGNLEHQQEFVYPFKLSAKDDYLYWLFQVTLEIQSVFSLDTAQYVAKYLQGGENDAKEALRDLNRDQSKRIIDNSNRIAESIMKNCKDIFLGNAYAAASSKLESLRIRHQNEFKFNAGEFVDYLTRWGKRILELVNSGNGTKRQHLWMLTSNGFTNKEHYFMASFVHHGGNHKPTIKDYFEEQGIKDINLADRYNDSVTTNQLYLKNENLPWNGPTMAPKPTTMFYVGKGGMCSYCNKPNHEEKDCWYKFPEQRPPVKNPQGNKRKRNHNGNRGPRNNRNKRRKPKTNNSAPFPSHIGCVFDVSVPGHSPRMTNQFGSSPFLWDTGSEVHIVKDWDLLYDFVKSPQVFAGIGGMKLVSEGYGKIKGTDANGNAILLDKVYYLKKSKANIISGKRPFGIENLTFRQQDSTLRDGNNNIINRTDAPGYVIVDLKCETFKKPRVYLTENEKQRAYQDAHTLVNKVDWNTKATFSQKDLETHIRTGHPNHQQYAQLRKENPWLPLIASDIRTHCQACQLGTMTNKRKEHESETVVTRPLQVIHADVCGPIQPFGYDYSQYFLVVVDKYTRTYYVTPMRMKGDTKLALYNTLSQLRHDFPDGKFDELRIDNGLEFQGPMGRQGHIESLLQLGITPKYTSPYNSHQNGTAERAIRALLAKARVLLIQSGLPLTYWPEAFKMAAHVLNNHPKSQNSWSIPYTFKGLNPKSQHIWNTPPFGCLGNVMIPNMERGNKVTPTAVPCVFVGPASLRKAYRCLILKNNRPTNHVIETHQASFLCNKMPLVDNRIDEANDPSVNHLLSRSHPYHFVSEEYEDADSQFSPVPVDKMDISTPAQLSNETSLDLEQASTKTDQILTSSPRKVEEDVSLSAGISSSFDRDGMDTEEVETQEATLSEPSGASTEPRLGSGEQQPLRTDPKNERQHNSRKSSRLAEKRRAKSDMCQNTGKTKKTKVKYAVTKVKYAKGNQSAKLAKGGNRRVNHLRRIGQVNNAVLDNSVHQPFDNTFDSRVLYTVDDSLANLPFMNDTHAVNYVNPNKRNKEEEKNTVHYIPETYKEAISCDDQAKWKEAIKSELESLKSNDTFTETDLPYGRRPIEYKWIFNIKHDGTYKARLVAKGFSQIKDKDYKETFSPVVKYDTVKISLALATKLQMKVHQVDVKTAFLNGRLKLDLYLTIPEGLQTQSNRMKVLKLNGALYGLKQAPLIWNLEINKKLILIGFTPNRKEPCLYYKNVSGIMVIVVLYVDDMLIMCKDESVIKAVKAELKRSYDIKDLGKASRFLGMNICQTNSGYSVSLKEYIDEKITTYLDNDKPCYNPCATDWSEKLLPLDDDELFEDPGLYREIIGKLLFASTTVRYDIAFITGVLARYCNKPALKHFEYCNRVLRYLKSTSEFSLNYTSKDKSSRNFIKVAGYSDADWGNCKETSKSVSGLIFTMLGAPILWKSKKQGPVALSSTEAEAYALCETTRNAVWLKDFLISLGLWTEKRWIPIYVDNQACLNIALQENFTSERTKHIRIRLSYIQDECKNGNVNLIKIPTENNLSDILTKGLTTDTFNHLKSLG